MTAPAEAELAVGIECYATRGLPCPARVKAEPEDFLVEESVALQGLVHEARPDFFPLYRVEKRSIDTMHMAEELSAALRSRVSYAGLKDKRAVAVQYATPTSSRSGRPPRVVGAKFTAVLAGYVPRPLSRGALVGNKFTVTIRECCADIEARFREAAELGLGRRLPNFFGLQRFGASGGGTHLVGRELVGGRIEGAVMRLLLHAGLSDAEESKAVEEAVEAQRYEDLAQILPEGKDVERVVARELGRRPGDWVRAMRAVPVPLRRLYVHAYQSWIFNRTLSRAVTRGEDIAALKKGDNWASVSEEGLVTSRVGGVRDAPSPGAAPMVQLVGYAFRDYGSRFDALIREVLDEEGVRPGQFYLKEMQEASSEGGFRRPHLAARDASWKMADRSAEVKFTLGKGQYATVFLREIIKPRDPAASGLA